MSVETLIHIVPVNRKWTATAEFLKDLLSYIEPKELSVEALSKPYEWDVEEEQTLFESHVSIEHAVKVWEKVEDPVTAFLTEGTDLCERIADSVGEATICTGEFVEVQSLCIIAGPQSIGDDIQGTVLVVNFSIEIGADNTPCNCEVFSEQVNSMAEIRSVIAYLEGRTGEKWEVTVTYSV